jgi:hypothetical protein
MPDGVRKFLCHGRINRNEEYEMARQVVSTGGVALRGRSKQERAELLPVMALILPGRNLFTDSGEP